MILSELLSGREEEEGNGLKGRKRTWMKRKGIEEKSN